MEALQFIVYIHGTIFLSFHHDVYMTHMASYICIMIYLSHTNIRMIYRF